MLIETLNAEYCSCCQDASSIQPSLMLGDQDQMWSQWISQSAKWRAELQVTREYAPFTSKLNMAETGLPLGVTGRPNKRVLDLLDCSAMQVCKRSKKTLKECKPELSETLVDISQSHVRRPMSSASGMARALTTSSRLFALGQGRLLKPIEHMMLQGFQSNIHVPAAVSDTALRKMAGEGMALPCLGTVIMAVLLAGQQ